jgi:hypothetical protein
VIIVLIAVATIASIIKVRSDPTLRAHAGSLHDTHREPNAESDEARR